MAKQENIWCTTTHVKTSAAGEKMGFQLGNFYIPRLLRLPPFFPVSFPLYLSNKKGKTKQNKKTKKNKTKKPPKKTRCPEKAGCARVTKIWHHHVFPATFTPNINKRQLERVFVSLLSFSTGIIELDWNVIYICSRANKDVVFIWFTKVK